MMIYEFVEALLFQQYYGTSARGGEGRIGLLGGLGDLVIQEVRDFVFKCLCVCVCVCVGGRRV